MRCKDCKYLVTSDDVNICKSRHSKYNIVMTKKWSEVDMFCAYLDEEDQKREIYPIKEIPESFINHNLTRGFYKINLSTYLISCFGWDDELKYYSTFPISFCGDPDKRKYLKNNVILFVGFLVLNKGYTERDVSKLLGITKQTVRKFVNIANYNIDDVLVNLAKFDYDSSKEDGGIFISTWTALFNKVGCNYNPECAGSILESVYEYKPFFDIIFDHKPIEELYTMIEKDIKPEYISKYKTNMTKLYNSVWNIKS